MSLLDETYTVDPGGTVRLSLLVTGDVEPPPAPEPTTPAATVPTTEPAPTTTVPAGPEMVVQVRAHASVESRAEVDAVDDGDPGPIIDIVQFDLDDVAR
ncbi:unnamed protein product, partial [Symbiodinium sp. KB8]